MTPNEQIIALYGKHLKDWDNAKPKGYWFNVFAGIASIVGTLVGLVSLWWEETNFSAVVFAITLCAITLWSLLHIRQLSKDPRKRYAYIIPHMRAFTYQIKAAALDKKPLPEMNQLLETISQVFSNICDAECNAILKTMEPTEAEPNRFVICQSTRKGEVYYPCEAVKAEDFSSLSRLLVDNDVFYICNDIPAAYIERQYKSPFLTNDNTKIEKDRLGRQTIKKWPLAYRSTMAIPIRGLRDGKNPMLRGVLCIDSPEINVFDQRFCPEFGLILADILYIMLHLQEQKEANQDNGRTFIDRRIDNVHNFPNCRRNGERRSTM